MDATFEDFINSFNDEELGELSYLHLPGTKDIDKAKIEYHLSRAKADWLSWFGFSPENADSSPPECKGSAISCQIAIARKSLDFNNPRQSVIEDVQFCYAIARDWKRDQIDKAKVTGTLPDPNVNDPVMSIFTA